MAISAHDDEICRGIRRVGQDRARHVNVASDDPLQFDLQLMARKVLHDVPAGQFVALEALGGHRDDFDGFGAGEEWHGVRNGPRRIRAGVPAHQHAVERERCLLNIGYDENRTSYSRGRVDGAIIAL
jgi:hypothetical protein